MRRGECLKFAFPMSAERALIDGAEIIDTEGENGAIEGIRTPDLWYHKPAL